MVIAGPLAYVLSLEGQTLMYPKLSGFSGTFSAAEAIFLGFGLIRNGHGSEIGSLKS